jgi:hypothetical protein
MKMVSGMALALIMLAACGAPTVRGGIPPEVRSPQGSSGGPSPTAPIDASSPSLPTPAVEHPTIDLSRLPIGDGKLSTQPRQGYLWQCNSPGNGGGAQATGAWFDQAAGTWNLSLKPTVDGQVSWPQQFSVTLLGDKRLIISNDLPNHLTGQFPISPSDDAYKYDRNPNAIKAQSIQWTLPANPTINAAASCVRAGVAGILLSGSVFFNAFDAANRDAVVHEMQDQCGGHPQRQGEYHYHNVSPCIADSGSGHSALVGYAADGFGVYGHRGENGQILSDADMDECHGHTHLIEWDGKMVSMYHYHATYEFPYTMGCFRGAQVVGDHPGRPPGGGPPPPPPG